MSSSSSSSADPFDLSARVASTTKDSIYVKWHVESSLIRPPPPSTRDLLIQGFQVRYQAVGSTVIQYSHRLDASTSAYDITQLHENTYYDICVKVFVRLNASSTASSSSSNPGLGGSGSSGPTGAQDVCVKGTTATDSLAVALGSTFGAFLALGFIVLLVFLAKWQHTRRMRKQKLATSCYEESGVEQLRGCGGDDDPNKGTFIGGGGSGGGGGRFHDDLAMSEISRQSSEVSIALYADHQMQDSDVVRAGDGGDGGGQEPSCGLPRNQPEASDLVHQWMAVTSDSSPPMADCEEGGNWLLRPPPIPGVILRPQTTRSTACGEGETEDKRQHQRASNSAAFPPSLDHPICSSSSSAYQEKQPAAWNRGGEESRPTDDEHSGEAEQQHLFAHRPLKPTASNLW